MTHASAARPVPSNRLTYLGIAAVASIAQMLMMIPGYNEDGEFQTAEYVVIFLISLAVGALVFMLVVPGGGAVTALTLAVVALISVLVFWAGLTLPLAAAGAVTAWRARQRGDRHVLATVALAVSLLAAIAVVAIIIGDASAN